MPASPDDPVLGVLRSARALISEPEHWTTRAAVRNRAGHQLFGATHPDAYSYCALGAVERAYQELFLHDPKRALPDDRPPLERAHMLQLFDRAIALLAVQLDDRVGDFEAGGLCEKAGALCEKTELVADFNDARDTTHADVLQLFDRAIAARENQEAQP